MNKEKESRVSPIKRIIRSLAPRKPSREWPASPAKTVTVPGKDGKTIEIPFQEYLAKLNTNNRGGT